MRWLKRKKSKNGITPKETVFAKILDDLTTLEINTIIKKGMNAVAPPEDIQETLKILLNRYKDRMDRIVHNNYDVFDQLDESDKNFSECKSYKEFHEHLKMCKKKLDESGKKGVRIKDIDYTRINRMLYFCNFIQERSEANEHAIKIEIIKTTYAENNNETKNALIGTNLYDIDIYNTKLKIEAETRDKIKINRYFDLSDERIVMQTRFGIDGDVVTRIEEDFSNAPKEQVLNIHNEHTNLSVNYWKSLINIAKGIIFHD
jgi:hypothetical protein